MHVDGAWANEQRLGDLAIRPPDRDEVEHLELTSRQSGVLEPTRRSTTESPLDLFTEQGQLFSHSGRERAGAEPSRSAVGGGQALDCQPTLPLAASAMPTRSSVSARPYGARSPRMSMACHREVDVGHLGPAWV